MPPQLLKQISCKRCQKRKIKCSRTSPCINCCLASVACEYRDDGLKRLPISRDYVVSLESRVAKLETFLAQLKKTPRDQRDALIDSINFLDESADYAARIDRQAKATENDSTRAFMRQEDQGAITYHGPTSIYNGALSNPDEGVQASSTIPLALVHSLDIGERVTTECIGLFFHFQYPQFMFIDREAFILDYQRRSFESQFCSSALVNAICSIGALLSPDPSIKQYATLFAQTAISMVMSHGLATPHTTSVQTLLCCAFFEIGAGNLSKGWIFSGMAFRMGQDLGFQRDPEIWADSMINEQDIVKEYRRRIYWGCYVSDKFFSLMLGRPSMMYESDGDVKFSQPQMQIPIFNTWAEGHGLAYLKDSIPVIPKLADMFNKQVEISQVIRQGLFSIHSPGQAVTDEWIEISLNEIDARFTSFKESLPPEMRMKEWPCLSEPVQPHLAALHMFWHSSRISLIYPFLDLSETQKKDSTSNTSILVGIERTCIESVERMIPILKRYRAQHGLKQAPLVFTHGVIAAVNTLIALDRRGIKQLDNGYLPDLELSLAEMASAWSIAGQALDRLRGLLSSRKEESPRSIPPVNSHRSF